MKTISERTRVKRLRTLRDFLSSLHARQFAQYTYINVRKNNPVCRAWASWDTPVAIQDFQLCGTRACIAGWAVLALDKPTRKILYRDIANRAQKLLGLTDKIAKRLFAAAAFSPVMHGSAAKKLAIQTLDVLIANKGTSLDGAPLQ